MASLWGFWRSAPAPEFPKAPRHPLTYCSPTNSLVNSNHSVDALPLAFDYSRASSSHSQSMNSDNPQMGEEAQLEEVDVSSLQPRADLDQNPEYRLLVKKYISREYIKPAVDRWLASLSLLPLDVPSSLELGPIQSLLVPFYVFTAEIESTCEGTYDMEEGGVKTPARAEIVVRDELHEILALASTELVPSLVDELLDAKAFIPPLVGTDSRPRIHSTPSIARHPFHAIRYKNCPFVAANAADCTMLPCSIPETLANSMISDFLVNSAGPFLAELSFKTEYGKESRSITCTTTVRSLVRQLLFLPIYSTSYQYHNGTYQILISGVNGEVAAQRMSYGSGTFGRTVSSLASGISDAIHKNI